VQRRATARRGWVGGQQRKLESNPLDQLGADPKLNGEPPHRSGRHDRLIEAQGPNLFDQDFPSAVA
jgi:hypothetical protein